MKKRILLSMISIVIAISILFSFSVTTYAALSGTVTGVMQDTSVPGSGKLYWKYTYNVLSGEASLEITGNGYMPNGTEQDWFAAQSETGCFITNVKIGEGVKSIMSYAFAYESYLEEIKLPSTIESIGEGAFAYTAIKEINIPAKVKNLDGKIFVGSPIEKFTVASGNPYYRAYGGHIYSKDYKTFVVAAPGKFENDSYTFSFHKSTTEIGRFAFLNCNVAEITVPYHIKTIQNGAFDGCESLKTLSIQNGVEAIYDNAFYNCSALHNIHLPLSVSYIGWYAFGYNDVPDYAGLSQFLDDKGISHSTINYLNFTYYVGLTGLSQSSFICPGVDLMFTVYATKGSSGEQYAKNNGMNYTSASCLSSVSKTTQGVLLKWNYSSAVSSYNIYRKKSSGSWTLLKSNVAGTEKTFLDESPYKNADSAYSIKVFYNNGYSYWDKSGISVHYVVAPVVKSVSNSAKGVLVKWSAEAGMKYYYIYRKAQGENSWKNIARVSGDKFSYTDESAKTNIKYAYTVRSNNGVSYSAYDNTGKSVTFVKAPVYKVSNTASGVTVKWDVINGVDGYRISRKTNSGAWKILETVAGNKTRFVDKTAKQGTTYTYIVRAEYNKVLSGYSPSGVKIKVLAPPVLKKTENRLNGIRVYWNKTVGASGYYVYRKVPGGSWKKIATVKGNSTLYYLDKNVSNSKKYVYTVKAYSGSSTSDYNKDGITATFLSAPKVNYAESTRSGIIIRYNAISGCQGYRVYRKTVNGSWVHLGNVAKGTTTYLDKTAKKGQTYIYTVESYKGNYKSGRYTNAIKIKDIY